MENDHMLLELDHISKIYGDLHAVDDLSLTVPQGQWLAIVGSSGSGKTTLMNMIGCMDTPSKGSVMLEGRRLEDLNARQLADVRKNMIGLVFQKFYLVPHLTAVENVMVAQYYHSVVDEKQAMEALERVGLKERAHHLPGQLSGGEQQRVCIARALINCPKLILADEPTGNLDEKNEELVDAQIVEEDSRMYGHAEGEPGGEVADEPALVLGDDDPHDAELHEKILSEECAWKGKILDVHRLEVELPNGHRSARDIVRHPGAAAVVALTESGKIVLVRQYRTAIDRVTVEIPAGKLDPGEDPLDCAKRELHEETGFRAGRIRFLTSIVTSCGFCDEIIHIYLATKLEFDAPNPDDDEFVNVDLVPLHELIDAVLDGKIEDAKTVVGALACDSIAHRLGGTEL